MDVDEALKMIISLGVVVPNGATTRPRAAARGPGPLRWFDPRSKKGSNHFPAYCATGPGRTIPPSARAFPGILTMRSHYCGEVDTPRRRGNRGLRLGPPAPRPWRRDLRRSIARACCRSCSTPIARDLRRGRAHPFRVRAGVKGLVGRGRRAPSTRKCAPARSRCWPTSS